MFDYLFPHYSFICYYGRCGPLHLEKCEAYVEVQYRSPPLGAG